MKKLLLTLSLGILAVGAFAQDTIGIRPMNWKPKSKAYQAQSLDVKATAEHVSVLWLRDGLSANYTALAIPMFQVTGLGSRFNIVGLGAFDSNYTRTNVWAGTGVSLSVVETAGWSVRAYGGYKGFNLGSNLNAAQGKEAFVYGLGLSIPIR